MSSEITIYGTATATKKKKWNKQEEKVFLTLLTPSLLDEVVAVWLSTERGVEDFFPFSVEKALCCISASRKASKFLFVIA